MIPELPAVPEALKEAAARTTLIPFVGAGASRLAGCPGWPEFADGALKSLVKSGCLTYAQVEQLKHLSARVKLSVARLIERQSNTRIDFDPILHNGSPPTNEIGVRTYNALLRLGNVVVTTNYDRWLDSGVRPALQPNAQAQPSHSAAIRPKVIWKPNEMLPSLLDGSNTVIHLHGSIEEPERMVMTTQDYLSLYQNDRVGRTAGPENPVLTLLEELFRTKTVLFVGYGLEELEILEFVILKARSTLQRSGDPKPSRAKHFLLQGFFSYQDALVEHLGQYYLEQCGIGLIPFALDRHGYDQLTNVLEDFSAQIPARQPSILETFRHMEGLLDD